MWSFIDFISELKVSRGVLPWLLQCQYLPWLHPDQDDPREKHEYTDQDSQLSRSSSLISEQVCEDAEQFSWVL